MSIILPTFNSEATLKASIESCLAQRGVVRELIVIDGGSTDGTARIIESYAADLAYWCSEKDQGIYDAWNKGLRQARGAWISFFGADDTWADSLSLSRLAALAEFPACNLVTARLRKQAHGASRATDFGEPWSDAGMRTRMTIAHVGMLHHRSLFEQFGEFDISYRIAGDYAFFLRAMPAIKARYLDEVVGLMGGGGVSSTQLRRVRDESFRALRDSPHAGVFCAWRFKLMFALSRAKRRMAAWAG